MSVNLIAGGGWTIAPRWRSWSWALLLPPAVAVLAPPPAHAAPCTRTVIAELSLTTERNLIALPVRINGQDTAMMLDTGAMHTQIASATARRLRLPDDPHHRSVITDLGGTGKPRPDALVDTLAVGWAITTPGHLPVVDMRQPPIGGHVLAGYLGADFLAQFDLDLDLPNRHLTLWRVAATCRGDFVPWRFAHAVLPAEQHPNGWLLVPAQLGGYRVRALLDTGTNLDFIGSNAAPVVHLEPKLAVSDWTILNRLVVSDVMWTAFRRFREFDFGPNRQVNLSIGIVGGALPAGDMLLGVATLRRQRVWLSYTTRQVFIAQRPVTPPP